MSLASIVRKALRGAAAERHSTDLGADILAEKERMRLNAVASEESLQETRQKAQIIQSSSRVLSTMSGVMQINKGGGS